jgi:hypothetical protein
MSDHSSEKANEELIIPIKTNLGTSILLTMNRNSELKMT